MKENNEKPLESIITSPFDDIGSEPVIYQKNSLPKSNEDVSKYIDIFNQKTVLQ